MESHNKGREEMARIQRERDQCRQQAGEILRNIKDHQLAAVAIELAFADPEKFVEYFQSIYPVEKREEFDDQSSIVIVNPDIGEEYEEDPNSAYQEYKNAEKFYDEFLDMSNNRKSAR
jgi:hypothetical protein